MSRYYVFYGHQLHSSGEKGSLSNLLRGAPEGSILHDSHDKDELPWFDRNMATIEEEDVPPLLRAMALMLGE